MCGGGGGEGLFVIVGVRICVVDGDCGWERE